MNIIGKKYFYFLISLIIIIPGIISLSLYGLNLSIEFTGGTLITVSTPTQATQASAQSIKKILEKEGFASSAQVSSNSIDIRTKFMDQKQDAKFISDLQSQIKGAAQKDFQNVGPIIGSEITVNAFKALLISSFLIVLYITWSFRKVPKPASSFRFGIAAIVALIHDALVLLGVFSILGHFWGVEIDSLFVTAILTVIGFSVHDTIVVFDRIRENLRRYGGENFSEVVNDSILQTLDRSLNTSLTVILVLIALLLFGGESIRWFVIALLIGIISGTYSLIFNASPLLVVWQEFLQKKSRK